MDDFKSIGKHLKSLLDDLLINLHTQLNIAGFPEIRPSHGYIFQYINEEGSRITELAGHAKITKQSMSALVYQLEGWGYLKREADSRDKRGVLFFLTDKGTALQNMSRQINYDFERQWESRLGIANYQKFRENLQKLCIPLK